MGRLIDADALIRELQSIKVTFGSVGGLIEGGLEIAISTAYGAPTIEERKKGEWYCSDDMFETGVCSVCKWDSEEAWEHTKRWWKFCPHCGAEMKGEGNG